jgi:hypothetical protein
MDGVLVGAGEYYYGPWTGHRLSSWEKAIDIMIVKSMENLNPNTRVESRESTRACMNWE